MRPWRRRVCIGAVKRERHALRDMVAARATGGGSGMAPASVTAYAMSVP